VSELDLVANRTLSAEIESDHPGFNDPKYKDRRSVLGSIAKNFRSGDPIPLIEYTDAENRTWGTVYRFISKLHKQYACQEYLNIVPLMEKHCGFSDDNIPQVRDISAFLKVSCAAPVTVNILISSQC
jgi:phenylalanine-4-hydroxylase